MSYQCLVCKKNFEGPKCPRCNSRAVEIVGDYQNALEKMKPLIDKDRQRFYGAVTIGVLIHRWKDKNGVLVPNGKDKVPIGTAWELWNKDGWNPNKVARIQDKKEIEVSLYVDYPTYSKEGEAMTSQELRVKIANLMGAELQQVGVRVHEDNGFTVLLRNDRGEWSQSAPINLFSP